MTSMPEVAAEWQNFDQLTADKLYELLRFRHDLCDSKRFLGRMGLSRTGIIWWRMALPSTSKSSPVRRSTATSVSTVTGAMVFCTAC